MDITDALRGRRSIRGYLDKPVPKSLIEEVIALASRAPSSMNTQPWHLHVLTGAPLEAVRRGNSERMLAGVPPVREISAHAAYEGQHRERQIEIAVQLFEVMGIERHDKEKRQDWVMRGFRQFDAPVSIVVFENLQPLFENAEVKALFEQGLEIFKRHEAHAEMMVKALKQ